MKAQMTEFIGAAVAAGATEIRGGDAWVTAVFTTYRLSQFGDAFYDGRMIYDNLGDVPHPIATAEPAPLGAVPPRDLAASLGAPATWCWTPRTDVWSVFTREGPYRVAVWRKPNEWALLVSDGDPLLRVSAVDLATFAQVVRTAPTTHTAHVRDAMRLIAEFLGEES